jgi:hypothetical protein
MVRFPKVVRFYPTSSDCSALGDINNRLGGVLPADKMLPLPDGYVKLRGLGFKLVYVVGDISIEIFYIADPEPGQRLTYGLDVVRGEERLRRFNLTTASGLEKGDIRDILTPILLPKTPETEV